MYSKTVLFSLGIALMTCTGCGSTNSTSTTLPKGTKLTPAQKAIAKVDAQIKKLKEEEEFLKAEIYEENDESMRQEFNHNWMTYEGDISTQEDTGARLKEIKVEMAELQKKKKQLQSK